MALKPEVSIGVGLGTAALVYGTYQTVMPHAADVRVTAQDDGDVDAARRAAAWTSAAIVAGVSLMAKDPTVFVIGGAMVVGLDVIYRHSNALHPVLKKAGRRAGVQDAAPPMAVVADDAYAG